ncbi:MAG: hypothetical protein ACOYL3_26680 [Desulfuromonadaceae bacterium]
MFELDESTERGAIIRVIGVGAFGVRVAGSMNGRIHKVDCFGIVQKGTAAPDNLPLIPTPRCLHATADLHDEALLEQLYNPDLVFVISNLAEEDGLLENICITLQKENIPVFLVIPESACTMDLTGDQVTLDGVIILSEASIEPPYPTAVMVQASPSLQNYIFLQALQQITDLLTKQSLMGIDFADVMVIICGGVMRLGIGFAQGEQKAQMAAEKAAAFLKEQEVELQSISSALISIYGSNETTMADYNTVNTFIHDQTNEECNLRIGIMVDDSSVDTILVSLLAIHRPSVEAVFPRWVKLHDKYDHVRHSDPSEQDSSIVEEDEKYEVPLWLQKTV